MKCRRVIGGGLLLLATGLLVGCLLQMDQRGSVEWGRKPPPGVSYLYIGRTNISQEIIVTNLGPELRPGKRDQ